MSNGKTENVVTHIIQQLTLGGAARALVATSKYSSRKGPYRHRVISLVPSVPDGRELAESNGVEVIEGVTDTEIRQVIQESDIVHINWWNNPQMQRLLRSDLPAMRTLIWYHVAGDNSPQIITPSIAGFADVNIATNPYTYRANDALGAYRDIAGTSKLRMILDPADLARVEGVELKPHDGFNVGYIGTVDYYKMHRQFVAMSAAADIEGVQFIVCGGGIQDQLLSEARAIGADQKFQFPGYVKDITGVISTFDVYGYPLCEQTYASGELNLQEVMACGVPPVVFPYGGVKDIIRDKFNGLIVNSEKEYTEALEFLYHNEAFRRKLGENAKQTAWEQFGAENAADKLNGIYDELMSQPKKLRQWGQNNATECLSLKSRGEVPSEGAETFCESLWEEGDLFRASATASSMEEKIESDAAIMKLPPIVHEVGILPYLGGYGGDPYLHYWSGLFWLSKKKFDQAQSSFVMSVQLGFGDFRVHAGISIAGEGSGNSGLKDEAYANCLKLAGDREMVDRFIGSVRGEVVESLGESVEELAVRAKGMMEKGAWNDASTVLNSIWDTHGDSLEIFESLATCSLEAGDLDGAGEWLKKAVAIDGCPSIVHFQLARVDRARGRLKDARKQVEDFIESGGECDSDFYRFYGEILFEEEDFSQACKQFHKVIEAHPGDWEILFFMAHCMARLGELEASKDLAKGVIKLNPNYAPASELLELLEANDASRQEEEVNHATPDEKLFYQLEDGSSVVKWISGHPDFRKEKEEYFLYKARQRFPESYDVLEALGIYEMKRGDINAAREHFSAVVKLDADRESGWTYLAQAAMTAGDQKQLEECLEHAFRINPMSLDGNHLLGMLLVENGQHVEAAKIFYGLIKQSPLSEEYYAGLRDCFERLGDNDSVAEIDKRIIELRSVSDFSEIPPVDKGESRFEIKTEIPENPRVAQAINRPAPVEKHEDSAPLVSVLVSTFNSSKLIEGCLDDLVNQTIFDKIEVLVIDSGSEENEGELVAPYCQKYSNIRYFRTEREPLYDSWNRGIEFSRGKYVTNANTDDAHRRDALEILANELERHDGVDLVFGDLYWTDVPNDTFENPSILREVKYGAYDPSDAVIFCPTGCHPMWRKSVFDKIGNFNSEFRIIGDYEFVLRFVEAGLQARHVADTISLFYQNEDGLSKKNSGHDTEIGPLLDRFRSRIDINRLVDVSVYGEGDKARAYAWASLATKLGNGVRVPWIDKPVNDWPYCLACFDKALSLNPGLWSAEVNMCYAAALANRQDILEKHFPKVPETKRDIARHGIQIRKPLWEAFYIQNPCAEEKRDRIQLPAGRQSESGGNVIRTAKMDVPLRWMGPMFNESGFASEAHAFLFGLKDRGIDPGIHNVGYNVSSRFLSGLPFEYRNELFRMRDEYVRKQGGILVQTGDSNLVLLPGAEYLVGRVMFETERLPESWVRRCNKMDELWVTGKPQAEAYIASGVAPHKIQILHGAIDERLFDPANCRKIELGTGRTFNFFAIFEWIHRKGWDVMFESYFREFSSDDDVCLIVRTYLAGGNEEKTRRRVNRELEKIAVKVGKKASQLPSVKILDSTIASSDLPSFYHSVDCVLSPSRGEGWGRPQEEAMLMGVPVISTGWGGNMEFMTPETTYLIDFKMGPVRGVEPVYWDYTDSRWAEPDGEHLSQVMRHVYESPDDRVAVGQRARQHILTNFGRDKVVNQLVGHLERIQDRIQHKTISFPTLKFDESVEEKDEVVSNNSTTDVTLEGSYLDFGSLSKVNREVSKAMRGDNRIRLTRIESTTRTQPAKLQQFGYQSKDFKNKIPKNSEFLLRHQWPPNWDSCGTHGVIMIQPWEFGRVPLAWVDYANSAHIEEIWCYSRAVKNAYLDSGVQADKLRVMPLGVDTEIYQPEGEHYPIATEKSLKFLFVGGTINRKGPDILLEAFCKQFSNEDDVCLVIKDFGGDSVYKGQTLEAQIGEIQNNPESPEIIYINTEISEAEMAGLYRVCDCLVHPYRGEGFGLPVLEAMACGKPVVVTEGGSTDDFVGDSHGWKIPARRKMIGSQVSEIPLAGDGWLLEPDSHALSSLLGTIAEKPGELKKLGMNARGWVETNFTWSEFSQRANRAFNELRERREDRKKGLTPAKVEIKMPPVGYLGNTTSAEAALENKNYSEAREHALNAIKERPFNPMAYAVLVDVCIATGNGGTAKNLFGTLKKMAPGFSRNKSLSKRMRTLGNKAHTDENCGFDIPEPGNRLSVCLITKDEEKYLSQCLESVKGVADQIVVVDTGSSDRTIEIAREAGAVIDQIEWHDNFSDARNRSLELADGDWILILDADEELSENGAEVIKGHLENPSMMAYRLPIEDIGREEEGINYVPRLFRNAPGLFYIGMIHEQVFSSVEVRRSEWGLKSSFCNIRLIHHGYTEEMTVERDKVMRNIRLLEMALDELPGDPNLLMNLGLELSRGGNPVAGVKYYNEAMERLEQLPPNQVTPEIRETILTQVSSKLLTLQRFNGIVELIERPLATSGNLTSSVYFAAGIAYMELGRYEEAIKAFKQCVRKKGEQVHSLVNPEVNRGGPYHCLGMCQEKVGFIDKALESFGQAFQVSPDSGLIQQDFLRLVRKNNLHLKAMEILNSIMIEGEDSRPLWGIGALIASESESTLEFGIEWTAEALKYFPTDGDILRTRLKVLLGCGALETVISEYGDYNGDLSAGEFAGLIWSRLCAGVELPNAGPGNEQVISRELIEWYKQWVNRGFEPLIRHINDRIDVLQPFYPTAHSLLAQVLTEIA